MSAASSLAPVGLTNLRVRAAHPGLLRSSLPRSRRRRQDPCEWALGLGSAKPIACDATAGSDLDAVAASWTIGSEGDGCAYHRLPAASHLDQHALWLWPGVRRAGLAKAGVLRGRIDGAAGV